jgi:uncharacterized protein (DUF1786 family)
MKILAIDIGAGTQDILLYDSDRKLENCTKMVLPSPGPLLAAKVDEINAAERDLFITGYAVGGGSFSRAVKRHLSSGHRVLMAGEAAISIRNNLEDVADLGIEIVEDAPADFEGVTLRTDELNLSMLKDLLAKIGENMDDLIGVAVAVQDHGVYRSGESNRKTRLSHMRHRLEENPDPLALAYLAGEIPEAFPRMVSAARRLEEQLDCEYILIMDTAPAAVVGCLADRQVAEKAAGNLLLINAGNGHTLACLQRSCKVVALLEHHTKRLEPDTFASYLEAFCKGKARDDDPYMASGHGLFYIEEPPGMEAVDLIAVTGPNRELLEGTGLDIYYPAPGGDMMMTGPMGLVRTLRSRTGR